MKRIYVSILLVAVVLLLGLYLGKRDEQKAIASHGVRTAMSEADVLRSLGEPTQRLADSPYHEVWGYSGGRKVEFSHGVVINSLGFDQPTPPAVQASASPAPSATPP